MIATWPAEYIGLPFAAKGRDRAGLDCWGLVRLVLAERFGRVLPIWSEGYDQIEPNPKTAAHLAACAQTLPRLSPAEALPGDVLLFRIGGELAHVGVDIGEGRMLHIHEGINVCIERWQGPRWQPRIEGAYRPGDGT
jgi:cell wall-associated NlpC family hydrolase